MDADDRLRELAPVEYERGFPLPKDYREPGEWVFARLMYPPVGRYYGGFQFLGSWKEGVSNWAMDYPRSDRHFASAVRRLSPVTITIRSPALRSACSASGVDGLIGSATPTSPAMHRDVNSRRP